MVDDVFQTLPARGCNGFSQACELRIQFDLGIGHARIVPCEQYTSIPGVPTLTVPNQPKTKARTFRIPDDIYYPAQEKARSEGTNLTALVNEWIWAYIHDEDPTAGV